MNENEKLQEKLDLLSVLKEDEENEKKKKVHKSKKHNSKTEKKEEIKSSPKKKSQKKPRVFLTIFSFLALVSSLTYLIYTVLKATEQINQPYLIITSVSLFVISSLLVLIGFTTNHNMQKKLEILGIFLISLYTGFQFLITTNILTLPTLKTVGDFSNMSINEVTKWAHENKITLEPTYEYSDSIQSDHIISQNIPADTLLKNVKKLGVLVSNGPNYESLVSIPNMVGWSIDDVILKIKDLKLKNVQIEYQFNDAIEKDIVFEQSKTGEIRRNDTITIQVSLGKEADLRPVHLEDLTGKEEFDATVWLKRNGIHYKISYEFHNDIENGKVISTTPTSGTLIDQKEMTVQVIISKGPKVTAPNLMEMSLDEITDWAIQNKLTIIYESEYNNDIKAGEIIRTSIKEGDILEENSRIYVVTSKGKLKMISIKDGDITSLRNFVNENKLTLNEESEFSETVEKGKFISISKKTGEEINPDEEIKVIISLGSSIEMPNFIGMNASKAQSSCDKLGLVCKFSYVYSSKTKGIIFNQSMNSGSKVIHGTTVVLTISNGPRPNNNSNGSNNGPNNSGSSTTEKPQDCVKYTLYLGAGSTVQQTQSIIQKQNPNGKFKFVTIPDPGYGTTGSLRSDMFQYQGTTHTSCETITIYIINKS